MIVVISKIKPIYANFCNYLSLWGIVVFFLSDVINNLFYSRIINFSIDYSPSIIIKSLYVAVLLFNISPSFKFSFRNLGLVLYIIAAFFSYFLLWQRIGIVDYFISIKEIVKFVFPFLLFYIFSEYQKKQPKLISYLSNSFILIIILNSIFIWVGFAFEIDLFRTYTKNRFGYCGLFWLGNEATSFYVLANTFLYYKAYFEKTIVKALFFFVTLSSLMLGTKGIIINIFFILFFHIYYNFKKRHISFIFITVALILVFAYISGMFSFFLEIYFEKGFIWMLTSGRIDHLIYRLTDLLSHWNLLNFLFGGHDYSFHYIEMDLFDLFLTFGIIGSIVVLYWYYFYFQLYKLTGNVLVLFYIQIGFVGTLTGHMLNSGVISIYIAFCTMYLLSINKEIGLN